MKDDRIFPAAQIQDILLESGIYDSSIGVLKDTEYCLPSIRWLKSFGRDWTTLLRSRKNLRTYKKQKNDCEDFVRYCADMARGIHAFLTADAPEAGLAVGLFAYKPEWSPTHHAILIAVTQVDDGFRPVFFEPQLGELHQRAFERQLLTPTEIESCIECNL